MQDVTPTPADEQKPESRFRGLFSRMAIGQCVHAALCVAIGAAIGLSAGRVSTALGIVLGILAAAAGAVICALWFRRRVSRPVEQITEVTRTIAGGRYGTELPVQRDDELGRLATAINELSQEISRSEKMQSEFISSISHELRTPLTAITGWSETLMFDTAIQGDSRRGIAIISKEAARLTSLVEELLEFTRIQDGRFNLSMELLDIESELEDTIFTYQELLRQDGMQLIYNPPEEEIPLVPGDPERLKQVFLNILDNAAKYACDGKTIEVSVFSDTEAATIQFRDHGPGIPPEDLPYLFDSEEHMWKAMQGDAGQLINDRLESANLVNLGFMHGGAKVFTSNKPLTCLADFKGQRLRAMETPIVIDTFTALGASAIPMNFSELYNALQQGIVDGQENPNQTAYMNAYYEVQDYCIETNHAWMIYGNVVNKDFWDSLTPELQQNMRDAMAYAVEVERETMNSEDAMYKEVCMENGMQFADLTDAQLQEIKDATKSVWEKEKSTIGEEFYTEFLEKVDQYR